MLAQDYQKASVSFLPYSSPVSHFTRKLHSGFVSYYLWLNSTSMYWMFREVDIVSSKFFSIVLHKNMLVIMDNYSNTPKVAYSYTHTLPSTCMPSLFSWHITLAKTPPKNIAQLLTNFILPKAKLINIIMSISSSRNFAPKIRKRFIICCWIINSSC